MSHLDKLRSPRSSDGVVIPFLASLTTGTVSVFALNFLQRHLDGNNVNDSLAALCEELIKRDGIDGSGCFKEEMLENPFIPGPDDALCFVGVSLLTFWLVSRRGNASSATAQAFA